MTLPRSPRPPPPVAVAALIEWFSAHGLDYPWRRTRDPYAVLVSEMMLQQTQIKTVLGRGYFDRWMERFPDVASLAAAEEPTVLGMWEGLGYYSRARNLLKAARAVMQANDGQFPETVVGLEALPGIGPYTARAVAAFAYDQPVPVVDANVTRVAARMVVFRHPVDSAAGVAGIGAVVAAMVPAGGGRLFGSALMELGQRICSPRRPACASCPVGRWCVAKDFDPESLPVKSPRRATVAVEEHAILAVRGKKILLHRECGRRRHGLWKLPERAAAEVVTEPIVLDTRYAITHHRVRLQVHRVGAARVGHGESWIPLSELSDLPMPSPYRKALALLL